MFSKPFRPVALSALFGMLGTAPAVLAQQPPPPPAPIPAVLQNYKPVTADRLKNPEDGELANDPPNL